MIGGTLHVIRTNDPEITGSSAVHLVSLNRPEKKNALSLVMRQAVRDSIVQACDFPDARAIVLSGGDTCFAAGADIRSFAEATQTDVADMKLHEYWEPLRKCPLPLIVSIEGMALGGGLELALSGDVIFAGKSAKLGFPEVKLGIMPGSGGVQQLVRSAGPAKAAQLLISGETFSTPEAAQWGLISEAVDDGEAQEIALRFARQISEGPSQAISAIRKSIAKGADLTFEEALRFDRKAFQALFNTMDQKEGMAAFLENRRPVFRRSPHGQ